MHFGQESAMCADKTCTTSSSCSSAVLPPHVHHRRSNWRASPKNCSSKCKLSKPSIHKLETQGMNAQAQKARSEISQFPGQSRKTSRHRCLLCWIVPGACRLLDLDTSEVCRCRASSRFFWKLPTVKTTWFSFFEVGTSQPRGYP